VKEIVPAGALVDRLTREYAEARARLKISSESQVAAA
jgi:hypothetical protein